MQVIEAKGARIPAIGLGTMTLKEQACIDAVKAALKLGYRHLDTAERYGNEEWVGEGLRQGLAETMAKQAARTMGSQVGRQILRGVLGGMFGGSKR